MAYTSGRTVKSRARKLGAGLTVAKATREARRVVDKVMPDANATVNSCFGHDLATDTPTVVTTITFPKSGARAVLNLDSQLYRLTGWWGSRKADSSIVITRKR